MPYVFYSYYSRKECSGTCMYILYVVYIAYTDMYTEINGPPSRPAHLRAGFQKLVGYLDIYKSCDVHASCLCMHRYHRLFSLRVSSKYSLKHIESDKVHVHNYYDTWVFFLQNIILLFV